MDLDKLKKKVRLHRRWVSKEKDDLEDMMKDESPDPIQLREQVSSLERCIENMTEASGVLEMELEEAEIDTYIDEFSLFKSKAKKARSVALSYIMSKSQAPTHTVQTPNANDAVSNTGSTNSDHTPQVRLPQISLPKFKGDILEWESFHSKFKAAIMDQDIPAVTKFTYLSTLLDGEPRRVIQGLTITDANFPVAMQLLENRYARPERVIFHHIQALTNVKQKGLTPTVSSLWQLQDEILVHVRSLEGAGIDGSKYGLFLTPLILSRLPEEIRLEWSRDGDGKERDLTFLLDFLRKEIERRERSNAFRDPHHHQPQEVKHKPKAATSTVSALAAAKASDCVSCETSSHPLASCDTFKRASVSQRYDLVCKHGLCFMCFGSHRSYKCDASPCEQCGRRHHILLCKNSVSQSQMTCSIERPFSTAIPLIQVQARRGNGAHFNVLFDSGSDRSYVSSKVVKSLNPEMVWAEPVTYASFGGSQSKPSVKNVYCIPLIDCNGQSRDLKAIEVSNICAPMYRPPVPMPIINTFFSDCNISPPSGKVTVDILIGLDFYWAFMLEGRQQGPEGLVAQETVFGWVLSGCWKGQGGASVSHQLLCIDDIPDSQLRSFWDVESVCGAREEEVDITCKVDMVDKRYFVSLPWNGKERDLLSNEGVAFKRLQSLKRKLGKNVELKAQYDSVFKDYVQEGIIEEVPVHEMSPSHPVFYMPHRPVVREESVSTKVRPVFDASAPGYNGLSLNDCLHEGPSLIPSLLGIMLRFRRWRIGLTADISRAFLQIGIKGPDIDAHRFLWDDDAQVKHMRFLRVPFGNKSSPFLLNATIQHHLSTYPETLAVHELKNNLYVDDFISGADSFPEAVSLFEEAKGVMGDGRFDLTKWTSNDHSLCKVIHEHGSKAIEVPSVKILGMAWDRVNDCFTFPQIDVPPVTDVTCSKRILLSVLARVFDPIGFLSPFTVVCKMLFQELWQLGVDWDAEVPADVGSRFMNWYGGLHTIYRWQIPRCLSPEVPWSQVEGLELHAFGDASERAYGCVVYVKVPQGDTSQVSLVMAKAKVAPIKRVTLPRLELLGALLCARLLVTVANSLELCMDTLSYKCWTDSMVVLGWVRGDPFRWKSFVANRVSEIQTLTNPSHWFHCPGKENPADIVSRGCSAEELVSFDLWMHGPAFLTSPDVDDAVNVETDVELPESELSSLASVSIDPASCVFPVQRWGCLQKAINIVAWVLRFINNCRLSEGSRVKGKFSYEDLTRAKSALFRHEQQINFSREYVELSCGNRIPNNSSIAQLSPFLDDDMLLRVKGRLQRSDLSFEEKHPVILPKGHLATLIVRFQHTLMKHAGVDLMISSLRNSLWIVGLRRIAKSVKKSCVRCQRFDARSCNEPAAPLPPLRVKEAPPFSVTGLDYAGPLYCLDFPSKKFYILLFTCAVVRAVHVELTESLNLSDCLLALRKFIARRGMPSVIYSDNAKTFKSASTSLQTIFGHTSPDWRFIVPQSPWWGGWWERLVRSIKSSLKRSLGNKCLTKVEVEVVLCEIEACINSRPLTFVGDEPDAPTPLTPAHFLTGKPIGVQPSMAYEGGVITEHDLKERKTLHQQQLDHFWLLWSKDYLRNLPQIVRGHFSRGDLKIGSVVLVRDLNLPRMKWPLGRIVELFPGSDGVVRSVQVKTAKGVLKRSIQLLHDLEIASDELNLTPPDTCEVADIATSNAIEPRSNVSSRGRRRRQPVKLNL